MDEFEKYYLRAVHFLKYRPRSIKEVQDKLREKRAPEEIIKRVIATLQDHKFLNDESFAEMWVRSRMQGKPKSMWLIRQELKQKGISQTIIEKLLGEKDKTESDLASATLLVQKKIHKYHGMERQEIYQKLGAFLARRGFSWDIIKRAIDDTLSREYN